ncbi:MAG TPA: NAD(P)/FAD-dependent oxidoreductase [Pseudomonadales bacterium]
MFDTYDVLILGGGAAGLMCAITAGQRGRRVLVLERANKSGKKILMSGGGRCNFTNLNITPENFLSANPHFFKSALSRYTQWDFIALVEKHGIAYHEKTLGQLFCDGSAKQILAMLLKECEQAGVEIKTHCEVSQINPVKGENSSSFNIVSNQGNFSADSLVVATGGLSIPTLGGSGFGYCIAEQFGLNLLPRRAGLVPFTFTDTFQDMFSRLSGVSVLVGVTAGGQGFIENMLFTHRGLSGPAILQSSSYWQQGQVITIDLLPNENAAVLLEAFKQTQVRTKNNSLLRTFLMQYLPKKLVHELETLWWPELANTPVVEIANKTLANIARQLNSWTLKPAATEGYRTAEVTLGGVDTDQLSSRTMECKQQPGLYFIGEVVDVTGHLGGFNFQWAWSSAYVAGLVV